MFVFYISILILYVTKPIFQLLSENFSLNQHQPCLSAEDQNSSNCESLLNKDVAENVKTVLLNPRIIPPISLVILILQAAKLNGFME